MQNIKQKILVTGASGFIGQHLTKHLLDTGYQVIACGRQVNYSFSHPDLEYKKINYASIKTLSEVMRSVDVVIHLAGKVHQMKNYSDVVYQHENTMLTQNLAQAAAKQGVQHFIFLSTIKVNGEKTTNTAFNEQSIEQPSDPYARSKWLAEKQVKDIAESYNMAWTIIRPPLVYGPQVRANFKKLLQLVDCKVPLPFKGIRNQRSMIALDNLVDFMAHCLVSPQAQNQLFCIADPDSVSTSELIKHLQKIRLGYSRLWPFPQRLLRIVAKLLGKTGAMNRLTESLVIDSGKAQKLLGWKPKLSFRTATELYFSR